MEIIKELRSEILPKLPFRIGDLLYANYHTKGYRPKVTKNPHKLRRISLNFGERYCWISCVLGKKEKEYYAECLWYKRENAIKYEELWDRAIKESLDWKEFEALREKDLKERK